jgi:hypothetical protein
MHGTTNLKLFSLFRYKLCLSFGQLIEPFFIIEVIIYCLVFARIDQPVNMTAHSLWQYVLWGVELPHCVETIAIVLGTVIKLHFTKIVTRCRTGPLRIFCMQISLSHSTPAKLREIMRLWNTRVHLTNLKTRRRLWGISILDKLYALYLRTYLLHGAESFLRR